MSSSDHLKSNGARLARLIIDQGTETLRKYFDSKHPPATLPATLYTHYDTLRRIGAINKTQMKTLFPPSGVLPALPSTTTSNDYDITLLFILIRNTCGLTPPASTRSWNENPPSADTSLEADLVRIKYYRNEVYAHKKCTEVSDDDFNTYWSEISDALVRLSLGLGVDLRGYIVSLKMRPLDEDSCYIGLLNEWYENDEKIKVLLLEIGENVDKSVVLVRKNLEQTKKLKENVDESVVLGRENLEQTKKLKENVDESVVLGRENLEQTKKLKENVDESVVLGRKNLEQNKKLEENVDESVVLGRENLEQTKKLEENVLKCIKATMAVLFVLAIISASGWFLYSYFKKETDSPDPQNASNLGFVGREWVFRELENITNSSDVRGVLLVADPGWGKSTIMRQLINSSSSSAVIHDNIIGHHFCKYNDERTRDGGRFVKKLVRSIAKEIRGFREIVIKDDDFKHIPTECFEKAIVEPLKKLTDTGRKNSFILIDALDECLKKEETHKSIILKILSHSSVSDLPEWVKLIVTSRNQAQSTGKILKINGLSTLKINVEDQRNEQDLRTYAEQTLKNVYTEALSTEEFIDLALESSKGNFLFLKAIIKYWQKYPHKRNAQSIPESLGDIYTASFAERFKEVDFKRFRPLLEVLLAANSPLTLSELNEILDYHYKDYNTREIAVTLSEYFKSDIDKGRLEFHHHFFAEWLTNQTDGIDGIFIQKSRGHQYIVDYLFHLYNVNERQTNLTLKELSELCMHILHAGEKGFVENVRKLSPLNVSEVRDSWKRCILHVLALRTDATKIIDALIKQFNSVDILDDEDWTPAMYAVAAGSYENVKLFIDNRANVNYAGKRTSCYIWDYIQYSFTYSCSMSFIAAYRGYTKIAKLLVTSGAKIEKADECGLKPLYVATAMGHLEIVQLYINNGAQADTISLHHAAARNHTEIVRFLLNTGVRDTCLPCKPGHHSWCRMNLVRFHHCICETALHAAVSGDNLEIAKLILEYGNASVNCKHGFGRTALMEAKNVQMVEVLISAGANVDAECEMSLTLIQLFYQFCFRMYNDKYFLYGSYCDQPLCNGHRVIDFSFVHGLWKMMIPLISKGKLDSYSSDNARGSLATVAGIYDQVDFINATYGNRINSIPHMETTLRYVAICHSVKVLKHLLNSGDLSKFTSVYEDGKTLLHFATLGSSERKTEDYVTKSCASSACVCPNKTGADIVDQKRLETVKLLTKELISEINKQDKHGRTALHYAAVHVLPKIVEVLVNAGADWSIKDQKGDTALEFALRERPENTEAFLPCRLTSDQVFRVCESTKFDEMASYLLQNATIKKCDMRAKKLLGGLIYHRLSLSLYGLFKSGLDVNCPREHFRRHLNRWRALSEILEVFKIFQINVEVLCDASFSQSELHLMAYSRTFVQVGNLFQSSVNGSSFPLQRFITSHLQGVEILNECYDEEGYLAIHRAVQGTNFDAVSWFIEIGVDVLKKTRSGLTSLALATYNYFYLTSPYFENRRRIFEISLKNAKEKSHASFECNTELIDLSPLHIAGSRGMGTLEIIHRKMPELPLNCTNSDGIQPIYLAYLYHAVSGKSSEDKQAFQNLGLSPDTAPLEYPEREAEYHLIYNTLFPYTLKIDLKNALNHEGLFECPGINELLPHKTVIKEYIKQRACATRCWQFAFEASRAFSSNFPYLDIQNNISNPFTDRFIDIAAHMTELRFHLVKLFHFNSFHFISISTLEKKLWRKVTKAHSCAHNCSCFEIMLLLQEKFTSKHRRSEKVGKLVAERMGWTDTSLEGDVLYRWPFSFLLKKALRTDQAYKYLEILSPRYMMDPRHP